MKSRATPLKYYGMIEAMASRGAIRADPMDARNSSPTETSRGLKPAARGDFADAALLPHPLCPAMLAPRSPAVRHCPTWYSSHRTTRPSTHSTHSADPSDAISIDVVTDPHECSRTMPPSPSGTTRIGGGDPPTSRCSAIWIARSMASGVGAMRSSSANKSGLRPHSTSFDMIVFTEENQFPPDHSIVRSCGEDQRPGIFTPRSSAIRLAFSYPASTWRNMPVAGSAVSTRSILAAVSLVPSTTITCPAWIA